MGSLEGDVTLRRQTYMPKDLCGALSHETEGAIFNAKKFGDRKVKVSRYDNLNEITLVTFLFKMYRI